MNDLALILTGFVAGLFIGMYITLKYAVRGGVALSRPGNTWARLDYKSPTPVAQDTRIVKVTDWEGAPELNLDDHTLTFNVPGADGVRREMTYRAAMILRLFKCDTPTRAEWRGGNSEYSRLLAIARHYVWVIPDGQGVTWAAWMATRERRLRVVTAWVRAGK